jgi:hypothetical protein
MKVYTEEQVKHAIKMARASQNLFTTPFIYDKYEILEQLTPIELPTDEEIREQAKGHSTFAPSFIYGAEWMRDKIIK